jgi:Tfp pilus assembly protein PilO
VNNVKEYRVPILIGVGTLVVALLLWSVVISNQSNKVSTLKDQETALQGQQAQLEAKLSSLKTEKQRVPNSCADLQKIATQIPSVQTPTDVDAEESSFESQFNSLAAQTGVTLTQFSGFQADASTAAASSSSSEPSSPLTKANVVAVPTTLTISGTYGQVTNFVNGLDGFPRLFVIQSFGLTVGAPQTGTTSTGSSNSAASTSAAAAAATVNPAAPPLWTGGKAESAAAGSYNLTIDGSIYYTTTPDALDTCVRATEAIKNTDSVKKG